jgi:hypothetical protein
MRAAAVVTGVLGAGCALVFAAAALTATMFPNGTVVNASWTGPWVERGWAVGGGAVPMPMPAVEPMFVKGGIDLAEEDVVPFDTVDGAEPAPDPVP